MTEGRGAWTLRGKTASTTSYARRDGQLAEDLTDLGDTQVWFESVHYGVRAIQILLRRFHYNAPLTGYYDGETEANVLKFQRDHSLPVVGQVGPMTMRKLIHPVLISCAATHKFHPRWLLGLAMVESGMDPGAQGWKTPEDFGLFQFNTSLGSVSVDEAFRPVKATALAAQRFADSLQRYSSKGPDLMMSCAIAQHRSPAQADAWYTTGICDDATLVSYVKYVFDYADEWHT